MLTPGQARILAEDLMEESADTPAAPLPDRIGSYRIRRVIGTGGMGTVYEAEQEHPRRTVALKVLNRGIASPSALRRFEHEAEMLAHLQHPGIAHIYEAGTHGDENGGDVGGVPFFAMEYVPGAKNIVEYAEAAGLSTRQRLELFAKVCDAVHHGHQKGIIHRDLKPANILVGVDPHKTADGIGGSSRPAHATIESGRSSQSPAREESASRRVSRRSTTEDPSIPEARVKIIDFGVARATDSDIAVTTMQTDVGRLIGTLQYMSPEQCEGDPAPGSVDIRSDVYSLGIVLYELVCGRLPYDVSSSSIAHAARTIQDQQPARPSTIIRKLRGDIEIITLKALEKDREKRYQSSAELAADIRRHLTGQPIEARPPTAWTRFSRWIAKHPKTATAAACTAIALLTVGLTFASVLYLRLRPYKVELTQDGREARLVSVAGHIIHRWQCDSVHGITFAKLVDRPTEFGGGRLALIGYASPDNPYAACSLVAFDISSSCDIPVWTARMREDELGSCPASIAALSEQSHFYKAWLYDVFRSSPGSEIIACDLLGASGVTAVRILDLDRGCLFQFWHLGTVRYCHWMDEAGLLVCKSCMDRIEMQPEDNDDSVSSYPYRAGVFAVQPTLRAPPLEAHRGLLFAPSGTAVWYKVLLPENAAHLMDVIEIKSPDPHEQPGRYSKLRVAVTEDTHAPSIVWLIDEEGNEVPGSRIVTDFYEAARLRGEVLESDVFRLDGFSPTNTQGPDER